MKLTVVVASRGHKNVGVKTLAGRLGAETQALRAQLDETQPIGTQYRWVITPPACLERVGKTFVPDYKATWRLHGNGTLYVEAVDRYGVVFAKSQEILVQLSTNDGGA